MTNQSCDVYYNVYAVSIFHNYVDTKVEKLWGNFSCRKKQHNGLPKKQTNLNIHPVPSKCWLLTTVHDTVFAVTCPALFIFTTNQMIFFSCLNVFPSKGLLLLTRKRKGGWHNVNTERSTTIAEHGTILFKEHCWSKNICGIHISLSAFW